MKLLRIIMVLSAIWGLTACSSDDDSVTEVVINYEQLPEQSRTFIESHFTDVQTIRVEKNLIPDADGTVYEVKLANVFEIDFDADGVWIEVDGNGNPVPTAIIPEAILTYVQSNYPPELFIESIEKKNYGYRIELSNDVELKFDSDGGFIGIGG